MLEAYLREHEQVPQPTPSILRAKFDQIMLYLSHSGPGSEGSEKILASEISQRVSMALIGSEASSYQVWSSAPENSKKRNTLGLIASEDGNSQLLVLKIGKPGEFVQLFVELDGKDFAYELADTIKEEGNPFKTIGREYWVDENNDEPTEGEEKNLETVPSAKYIFNRFIYSPSAKATVLHVGCHINPKEFSEKVPTKEEEAFDVRDFLVTLSGVKPTADGQALEMIDGSDISAEVREQILALARFKISDDGKQILPKPDFA